MNRLIADIFTGIATFTATNIDDLLILTLFFSKVNDQFRPSQIIIGQCYFQNFNRVWSYFCSLCVNWFRRFYRPSRYWRR